VAEIVEVRRVGVLGASSMVGMYLTPVLVAGGWQVTAFSRQAGHPVSGDGVVWQQIPESDQFNCVAPGSGQITPYWICVAPVWALPNYFDLMLAHGSRRLVVLSSTSRYTKQDSRDSYDQATAIRLAQAEAQVQAWAGQHDVQWTILRSTLIYAWGQDKNVSAIADFVRRFGFFPLVDNGTGLRQPVQAEDVALACSGVLQAPRTFNRAYNIAGAETLSYRAMVDRIFLALGRTSRFVPLPLWIFKLIIPVARLLPRYKHYSVAMAERMNRDLVFDYSDATKDFGFRPNTFALNSMTAATKVKADQ
jgi:nucleoside-diphosphate-sugar epimerase